MTTSFMGHISYLGPKVQDYEHTKDFKWSEYEGKSYSALNQAINGKTVVLSELNDKIQTPKCVILGMLAGIIIFGVPLIISALTLGYGPNIGLTHWCIALGTLTACSALVAIVATAILINRHNNKLTQEEIQKIKGEFDKELQEKVVKAEKGEAANKQYAKESAESYEMRKKENVERYEKWAEQDRQFVRAFKK